jgi:hypothetical protein
MKDKTKKFDGSLHQIKVVTPRGEARWAKLDKPDSFQGDDKKNFSMECILSEADAQPIIDQCTDMIEKLVADMDKEPKMSPHNPWKTLDDGRIALKFKRPHFAANNNYPATPPIKTIVDGCVISYTGDAAVDYTIGNGSIVQVGGYIRPYFVPMIGLGISLRLGAVNVITLEKYTPGQGSNDFSEFVTAEPESTEETIGASDF